MSYNPVPPRVWSRVQNQCTYTDASGNFDINYNQVYIPLTKQTVTQAQANYEDKMIYKGNVLQYKGNSSRLTKSQKYTQLAKGFGPNRTKVFATQSQTYTNPNITGLRRINYQTYPYSNQIVGAPNNPSGPFQYNVQNPNDCSNNSIQDGGTLVCGTFANPCTGEIIKQGATSSIIYNPASASDVPGSSVLFWDTQVQTWFPKPRYVMNNSTDKWPVNYKGLDGKSGLVSAITPSKPYLMLIDSSCNSVTLSWIDSSNNCIIFPISSYNIYQNEILVQTVPYTTTSTTINGLVVGTTYAFFITSVSNTIESLPSNIVYYNIPFTPNALGSGLDNTCYTISIYSGNLYAGGTFTSPGNNIAKWNGTSWSALGSGLNSNCYTISIYSGNLYAGGTFTSPGNFIAKWDGTLWSALGSGLNGVCFSTAVDSGNLYAIGNFTTAGGNPAANIAKWSGTTSTWSALGSGLTSGSGGFGKCVTYGSDGNLYAGGSFSSPGNNIAKWNGTVWSALGSGLVGDCQCLTYGPDGNLYAGGNFASPGNFIAKWNGTTSTWSALGTGLDGICNTIAFDSTGNLYAGGFFTTAGGISANFIAKWDGTSWSNLCYLTLDGICNTIAFDSTGNFYAGGDFTTAGSVTVNHIVYVTS